MEQPFHVYIFEEIRKKLPGTSSVSKFISELLGISSSAAYRKINGEVPLTIDEALLLIRHFHIPLDKYLGWDSVLSGVQYSALVQPEEGPESYLKNLLSNAERISRLEQPEILYASQEVPVFYYGLEPKLLAFKLFMWSRITYNDQSEQDAKFSPAGFMERFPQVEQLGNQVFQQMAALPIIELWSSNYLVHSLRQVQSAHYERILESSDIVEELLDCLYRLMNHLEAITTSASRQPGKPDQVKIYLNDSYYTNNTVLVKDNGHPQMVLSSFDNPHFMVIYDTDAIGRIHQWLEAIRRKSMLISGEGDRFRRPLFEKFREEIEKTREKIKMFPSL